MSKNVEKRKCSNCKKEFPLTTEYFHKTTFRGKPDFHRYCKPCRKLTRKDGYKYKNDIEKRRACKRSADYQRDTIPGRAMVMLKSYKTTDRKKGRDCDLTKEWIISNIIDKPCFYCGDTHRTGCERLDNNIGHTMNNCVPCCPVCNSVRSDILTVLEMKEIGDLIKKLKTKRNIIKVSGNKKKDKITK